VEQAVTSTLPPIRVKSSTTYSYDQAGYMQSGSDAGFYRYDSAQRFKTIQPAGSQALTVTPNPGDTSPYQVTGTGTTTFGSMGGTLYSESGAGGTTYLTPDPHGGVLSQTNPNGSKDDVLTDGNGSAIAIQNAITQDMDGTASYSPTCQTTQSTGVQPVVGCQGITHMPEQPSLYVSTDGSIYDSSSQMGLGDTQQPMTVQLSIDTCIVDAQGIGSRRSHSVAARLMITCDEPTGIRIGPYAAVRMLAFDMRGNPYWRGVAGALRSPTTVVYSTPTARTAVAGLNNMGRGGLFNVCFIYWLSEDGDTTPRSSICSGAIRA
jgi:hypothetical protein